MLRTFLCFSVLLAACGDNLTPPFPASCEEADFRDYRTVSLWVQKDPDLGVTEAVAGCDIWSPKCLQCELAPTAEAAAGLYVSHEDCVFNPKNGGYVLAFSEFGGRITIIMECIRQLFPVDADGHPSRKILSWVIGHEIGHEAGMWWHVPAACDEAYATNDFEKDLVHMGICGKALMNAFIDTSVTDLTVPDKEAFDLRDPRGTTFPHLTASETGSGCVLTYRPAL